MSTERTKQILNSQLSKESVNTDSYLHINIEGNERILPTNKINKIVNVADRFNVERQRSPYYRILGTINPSVSNVLFNLNNPALNNKYTWATFNDKTFLDNSWPEDGDFKDENDFNYDGSIKHYLKDKNGWLGHYDPNPYLPASSSIPNKICAFYDMEPKRERFSFIPDKTPFNGNSSSLPVKNWELTITYPKEMDKEHNMVKGGLLIIEKRAVTVATRGMTALATACKHNLKIGDTVRIAGTTNYNGDFVVVRTGLDDGKLKEYYFVIDKPSTGSINSNSRMKRVVGGIESEYYFRIFKKIGTRNTTFLENDDYETYPTAFSENYYNDTIPQFVFNEDINVSGLTDNLGRPLSELYLTIIKTDSNSLFSKVSSGIETPFIDSLITSNTNTYLKSIPVISRIHNGVSNPFPTHTPLETDIKINSVNGVPNKNLYYGDLVEYNKNELLEIVLAEVNHRFNTINRETAPSLTYVSEKLNLSGNTVTKTTTLGPRQEGYYYKAHHLIKIREFSNYIEVGDANTFGVPNYAINLGDDRYLWRDLIDIGFNQSNDLPLDYPFINGCHYMYQNYCFNVKRQDPFAQWKLYYSKFPADPFGAVNINNSKVKINSAEDVC